MVGFFSMITYFFFEFEKIQLGRIMAGSAAHRVEVLAPPNQLTSNVDRKLLNFHVRDVVSRVACCGSTHVTSVYPPPTPDMSGVLRDATVA